MNFLFLCLFILFSLMVQSQELITYDIPKQMFYSAHNDDYTVKVRIPGGEWKDLYEYKVDVDMDNRVTSSMVYFDFSDKVEVQVKKNNGVVNGVDIRPLSYGIKPHVEDNIISFNLDRPRKLSLEVNGDKLQNLHIFANSIMKDRPDADDPDVMYFGPGLHVPSEKSKGVFDVPSNKLVFIDGGAVLKGKLLVDSVENVVIKGHGIIFQGDRGVEIKHSRNITVDGLIFINPKHYTIYGGQVTDLTVRNIKSFSNKGWSDGIDLMSCSNVLVEDVFMRNSDDCIAIYGHRWDAFGNSKNILVRNSSLWADIAHPINIGLHGNAEAGGDTIEHVVFRNIDILEHDEDDRNCQGCMAICPSDNNLVRNICFDDIRIENFQEGQLFNIRVLNDKKYSKAPGRGIENLHFKNVRYNGKGANPSMVYGYDSARSVRKVIFEEVWVNGKKVMKESDADIQIGNFVSEIEFK